MLSKTCIYGIRATLYVATQNSDKFMPINQIAEALDISFHFLTKILQLLTQQNIMKSYRGPNGGIALAKAPEDIFISDIIKAIDGDDLFKECILGLPGCGELQPCPMHDEWGNIRAQITYMFNKTSVGEMAERIVNNNLRISDINWKDLRQ
jgi:Rrf2 family protein